MNEESAAMVAARASWSAVQRKAKEEWLSIMADDVVFQDPIGVPPLDSTGKGHVGHLSTEAGGLGLDLGTTIGNSRRDRLGRLVDRPPGVAPIILWQRGQAPAPSPATLP